MSAKEFAKHYREVIEAAKPEMMKIADKIFIEKGYDKKFAEIFNNKRSQPMQHIEPPEPTPTPEVTPAPTRPPQPTPLPTSTPEPTTQP